MIIIIQFEMQRYKENTQWSSCSFEVGLFVGDSASSSQFSIAMCHIIQKVEHSPHYPWNPSFPASTKATINLSHSSNSKAAYSLSSLPS
mmetsp:Transcript_17096/g.40991  ORF Transcript_17096/g.40991 Transcript_17096/m.40991 type:complete len:89 (-) Transcript_17096:1203-1469(-)